MASAVRVTPTSPAGVPVIGVCESGSCTQNGAEVALAAIEDLAVCVGGTKVMRRGCLNACHAGPNAVLRRPPLKPVLYSRLETFGSCVRLISEANPEISANALSKHKLEALENHYQALNFTSRQRWFDAIESAQRSLQVIESTADSHLRGVYASRVLVTKGKAILECSDAKGVHDALACAEEAIQAGLVPGQIAPIAPLLLRADATFALLTSPSDYSFEGERDGLRTAALEAFEEVECHMERQKEGSVPRAQRLTFEEAERVRRCIKMLRSDEC